MAQRAVPARERRIGLDRRLEILLRRGQQLRQRARIRSELLQPAEVTDGTSQLQRARVVRRQGQGALRVSPGHLHPVNERLAVSRQTGATVCKPATLRHGLGPRWVRSFGEGEQRIGAGEPRERAIHIVPREPGLGILAGVLALLHE